MIVIRYPANTIISIFTIDSAIIKSITLSITGRGTTNHSEELFVYHFHHRYPHLNIPQQKSDVTIAQIMWINIIAFNC